MAKWLKTDPYDLALEDNRTAFLSAAGVELFSKEWYDLQPELDRFYLANRVGESDTEIEGLDFSQPCGGSHISSAYTCRVGVSGYGMIHAGNKSDSLQKGLDGFEKAISEYGEPQQEVFRDMLRNTVKRTNADQRVSDETKQKYYERQIKSAAELAREGPPKRIVDKNGNEVPMSDKIYPTLSPSGNKGWKDPVQNVQFTARGDVAILNRETMAGGLVNGRVQASIDYYGQYKKSPEMQAKGPFGSAQAAQLREPSQKEVDTLWSSLGKDQQRLVALSGVDSVGNRVNKNGFIDGRSAHSKYYQENSDQVAVRGKEVVKAYLRQTPEPGKPAISPWTGLEVALPGGYGADSSVVDHVTPLSTFYPKASEWSGANGAGWSKSIGSRVTGQADVASNIVIGEKSINNGRGTSENWDRLTPGWKNKVRDYGTRLKEVDKMPSFIRTGQSSTSSMTGSKPSKAQEKIQRNNRAAQKKNIKKVEAPKRAAPKITAAQRTAYINSRRDALKKAKADKRSGDIARIESELKLLEAAV